jgi:small-conductance mechanosensitive channel
MPNLDEIQLFLATYIPKAALAAIIILVGLSLGRVLRKLVTASLTRIGADAGMIHLLGQMAYWGVTSLGILVALSMFADLTALVASLGLIGFALTFALQNVLKNFVAGIILLVQRPFIVGDDVRVMDYEGTVRAVYSRSTVVLTGDGLTVMLPNASVLDNPIVNFTRTPNRRIEVVFDLPYDSDLPRVRELAVGAMRQVPGFLDSPAPDVLFEKPAGGITLRARLWVDTRQVQVSVAKDRALSLIYEALKAEEIGLR